MAAQTRARRILRGLKTLDDYSKILTGKRLSHIGGRAMSIFGEGLGTKATKYFFGNQDAELPLDSPYRVLGVYPDSYDSAVRGAFRSLARDFHPDTGAKPDPAMLQKVTEAYNTIMAERSKSNKES